jgi:hypothetical protein
VSTKRPRWTIASARQNLPTLIGMAAREPQEVYRRDELVARVVSPELVTRRRPLAEALAELQRICAEEDYELAVPTRGDRSNPFAPARKSRSKRMRRNRNR